MAPAGQHAEGPPVLGRDDPQVAHRRLAERPEDGEAALQQPAAGVPGRRTDLADVADRRLDPVQEDASLAAEEDPGERTARLHAGHDHLVRVAHDRRAQEVVRLALEAQGHVARHGDRAHEPPDVRLVRRPGDRERVPGRTIRAMARGVRRAQGGGPGA
jgi:hypothetical protein